MSVSNEAPPDKNIVFSPFDPSGEFGSKLNVDNYRADELVVVELLNPRHRSVIPRVDFVLVYYKYASADELKRVKSFQRALEVRGIKIETFRDKDKREPYMYSKLYITYKALLNSSDFKYSSEEQYTSVQRAYAIEHILLTTVSYSKLSNERFKRFDYRRMIDDSIYLASFIPHEVEPKSRLLKEWALAKNILNPQPIEDIKNYFGATIAIHFAWCEFYSVGLLVATLLSLICYIISCFTIHNEFEYPILEVCAGAYDVYPRCPTCQTCNFTMFSESCTDKKSMTKRSNFLYAFLMSIWLACLSASFREYLKKMTKYWEKPYNSPSRTQEFQEEFQSASKSEKFEPLRVDFVKRFPTLLKMYEHDYDIKNRIFDKNYVFTILNDNIDQNKTFNRKDFSNHSIPNDSEETAILVEKQNEEPSSTDSESDSENYDESENTFYYDSMTCNDIVYLYARRFIVGILFIVYYFSAAGGYIFILVRIKNIWKLSFVNSLLNLFFKYALHTRVVYYTTKCLLPKTQSQFDWIQSLLLTFCQLIEYSFFAYVAVLQKFHFTDPSDFDLSWFSATNPCKDDDCHLTMADAYMKIVAMDQFTGLLSSLVYPGFVSQFFGIQLPDPSITKFNRNVVYNISKWTRRILCSIVYPDKGKKRNKSIEMENKDGRWLVDAKLLHDYFVRPNMVEYYLKVLGQLAYVSLFASNWFWSPIVIYAVTLVQTRLHAYHLLQHYRRPVPQKANKLNFWGKLIYYMIFASIFTNAFIYSVLSDFLIQSLHWAKSDWSLKGYFNTSISFYDAQKVIKDHNLNASLALDYCVYVGNKQPPWSDDPYAYTDFHASIVCKRTVMLLLYLIVSASIVFCCVENIIWILHYLRILLDNCVNALLGHIKIYFEFIWSAFAKRKRDNDVQLVGLKNGHSNNSSTNDPTITENFNPQEINDIPSGGSGSANLVSTENTASGNVDSGADTTQ